MSKPLSLLWLRRDLRLHDHAALAEALASPGQIQPVFIFDTDILARFGNKADRRLTFIAQALCNLHLRLQERGSGLLLLHGSAKDVLPKLATALGATAIFAGEDCEPDARGRDAEVGKRLQLTLVFDHLLNTPRDILRDGKPYRVFTPYANAAKAKLRETPPHPYTMSDSGRYADYDTLRTLAAASGLHLLDGGQGAQAVLEAIGYIHSSDTQWDAGAGHTLLKDFSAHGMSSYKERRDYMAIDGTSRLSPYLRFGLVSVRDCAAAAMQPGMPETWLNEMMWRDFYAMILYHYPESAHSEYQPHYRGALAWSNNRKWFAAWQEGETGYPIVDAAMRQLSQTGWMHNRARMIVASFLTKHLRIDWRWGEEHFAQLLMDYDQASNVGGWQWAASTGTDAQPWFRIFNPQLQSQKFDPKGDYIRRFVPELAALNDKDIHNPASVGLLSSYPAPLVDHKTARQQALAMFKSVTS